jgi:hypothetical protein
MVCTYACGLLVDDDEPAAFAFGLELEELRGGRGELLAGCFDRELVSGDASARGADLREELRNRSRRRRRHG